jgi:UDP-glucose 4-epimerase
LILVTGGLGFIGSHTTRALLESGAEVLPTSRTRTESPLLPSALEVARLDCTDPKSLSAVGRRHRITAIVHLAAVPLGREPLLAELRGNVDALLTVLSAAARWNVGRVVVASSIGVYAGVETLPWHEDAPLPVTSPHPIPAAKKSAEILSLASGLDVIVARIGGIWGPLGRPANPFLAAPGMIHAAARASTYSRGPSDSSVPEHGDDAGGAPSRLTYSSGPPATGTYSGAAPTTSSEAVGRGRRTMNAAGSEDGQPGDSGGGDGHADAQRTAVNADGGADMLYAPDCGAALAMLATTGGLEHRVYNVGGGRPTTNGEVAAAITRVSPGFQPSLTTGNGTAPIPHLDIARIRGAGWNAQWQLDRAVADYIEWLKSGHER